MGVTRQHCKSGISQERLCSELGNKHVASFITLRPSSYWSRGRIYFKFFILIQKKTFYVQPFCWECWFKKIFENMAKLF